MLKKIKIPSKTAFTLICAFALAGCADNSSPKRAVAELNPTEGSNVTGRVLFLQEEGAVRIEGSFQGLTPGKHGFHIHEFGDCSAPDASSAGGHFNPYDMPHSGPDDPRRHVGDLGNLDADDNGFAVYEAVNDLIELSGPNSIIGKSVIVHEKADDFVTQPTGDAGGRQACGVIKAESY